MTGDRCWLGHRLDSRHDCDAARVIARVCVYAGLAREKKCVFFSCFRFLGERMHALHNPLPFWREVGEIEVSTASEARGGEGRKWREIRFLVVRENGDNVFARPDII